MTDTEKRPRDMTLVQLQSLPMEIEHVFTPFTEEDYRNGAIGLGSVSMIRRPVGAAAYEPDDITFFTDQTGQMWGFGQFADGTWYKKPI